MTLLQWQKHISYQVMVQGEVSTGMLCEMLSRMWHDAQSQGSPCHVFRDPRAAELANELCKLLTEEKPA